MGFFQDLREDLSQAVSEFTGEDKYKEEVVEEEEEIEESDSEDIFAAAEESMGIDHSVENAGSSVEASLGAFLDQIAANAESAQDRYDTTANNQREVAFEPKNPYVADSYGRSDYKYESPFVQETYEPVVNEVPVSDEVSVITANMIVNGNMVSIGSLEVIGVINGNIKVNGELSISGEINGNSEASTIIMTGARVNGDVTSDGSVKVGSKAVVRGNIYANSAVISGAVKGDIDVHGPVILDSTAIVMGNIKSKTVQINNGAAIEGMCSQCYAEVNPSAFFNE